MEAIVNARIAATCGIVATLGGVCLAVAVPGQGRVAAALGLYGVGATAYALIVLALTPGGDPWAE